MNELIKAFMNAFTIDPRFKTKNKSKIELFLKQLSKQGWFTEHFDTISHKEMNSILSLLYSNEIESINELYIQHLKTNIESIKTKIIKNNIEREYILSEAFQNIEDNKFHSAIVLLLTQIDGICIDHYGRPFFINDRKDNFKPKVYSSIKKGVLKQNYFIAESLGIKSPINAHESEIDNFSVRLNRHEIIHGIDVNFGSELNAYKVLSLVAFINKCTEFNFQL